MAVTATPIFSQALRCGVAAVSTANSNRDGTGTIVNIFTAGPNGSIIDHIDATAVGTTTAGMLRLFTHDGSTARLWKEIPVSAITPSGTLKAFFDTIDCSQRGNDLFLPNGFSLRASTHNAETFNVHAIGSDL